MDTTSITLFERLRQPDDKAAWERFVALYAPMLTRWARSASMQEQDAADLVQDVLLTLTKKMPTFEYDGSKSFRCWLKAVTLNKWRDRMRRKDNHQAQPHTGELEAHPESEIVFEETEYRRQLLTQALTLVTGEFQEKTWQAFDLHGLQGLSAAEAATKLGISEASVYTAKSRVLRRLREELGVMLT